jgi:hypothetical protein
MTQPIQSASSLACIASVSPAPGWQEQVDFLTRFCGLSLPTLFEWIGTMATGGHPAKTTPTSIASGPAARLQPDTDGGRQAVEQARPASSGLTRADAGRVSVDVSVPLGVPFALCIVG